MLCFNIKFVYFPENCFGFVYFPEIFWLCLFSTILTKNSNFWLFLKLNSLYWWKTDKVKNFNKNEKFGSWKYFFIPHVLQKLKNWQLWVCSKLSRCQVKIKKSKFQRKFEKFKSFLQFLNFYLTPTQLWTNPQLSIFELLQHMRDEKIFSVSKLFIFIKIVWLCLFPINI